MDPLVCPKCTEPMRVIAFIEQADVNAPPLQYVAKNGGGHLPTSDGDMADPIYPVDEYF